MNSLLFTGASGFIGFNTLPQLSELYNVRTLGLSPQDDYNLKLDEQVPHFTENFDIIFHAAGKAHSVPHTEKERQAFFDVNLQGTKNLCAGLLLSGIPKAFIFVSTVAVYGLDAGENITEDYPLKGDTPYALSKIQAEEFLADWCSRHGVVLSIIRPSLIAGHNPPGNLGAMIHGIKSGRYLSISGGKAKKSVLMVQDVAKLIPLLTIKGGIYNVCDSVHPSFKDIEQLIVKQLHKQTLISIPYFFAKILALMGDVFGKKFPVNSTKLAKITCSLTFSNKKAISELGWVPTNVIENFII